MAEGAAVVGPALPPPAPLAQGDRMESMDVLRGFALLGILAMNIAAFSGPFAGYMNPTVWPTPYEGGNRVAYWLTHLLFDMKMMSLFSMLFGAGVVVWGAKARTREEVARVRWLWLRRMGWLFAIGMCHAWLLWEGDILVAYALTGAILAWWVRRLPVPWLIALAGVLFLIHVALMFTGIISAKIVEGAWTASDLNMPESDFNQMREGIKEFTAPNPEQLQRDIDARRGSWVDVFAVRGVANLFIQTQGFAFYIFWRAGAMMVLGMALVRSGVFTGHRSIRFYAIMAALGYAIGIPMVVMGILDNEAHAFAPVRAATVGTPLNVVGSLPVALGHAGLLLLVVKAGALGVVRRALAAAGQMALTNYLAQTLICTTIFYGYGLGLYGTLDRPATLAIVGVIWVLQLAWSPLWLSRFRFGPAEWVWRSLTYFKVQPMRRAAP